MAELSNIALIEKYVNYELTEAEELLLEKRLQNDDDFKTEFELAVFLHARDRVGQRAYYKNVLQNPEMKPPASEDKTNFETPVVPIEGQSKKMGTPVLFNLLKLAAALIVVPLLSILVYQNVYNSLDAQVNRALAIENTGQFSFDDRSGSSDRKDKILSKAAEAYNRKDFYQANQFLKTLESDSLTSEQNYYYAKSLLFDKAYLEAINRFDIVLANNKASNLHKDSKWYKALALLKLDTQDEAKSILTELLEEGERVDKINSLLKKLK